MSKPFLVIKQSHGATVTLDPKNYGRVEVIAQNSNGDVLSDVIFEHDEDIVLHVVAHAQGTDYPPIGVQES